jgi:uncharacterized membrane protein
MDPPAAVTTTWPNLTRAFRRFLGDKASFKAWRQETVLSSNLKEQAQEDVKAQTIRGPVSLVVAVLRTASRAMSAPLTALEGSNTTMSVVVKLVHSVMILVLMALVYMVYTKTTFAEVNEEHTYVITTTLAWIACFLLILWLT